MSNILLRRALLPLALVALAQVTHSSTLPVATIDAHATCHASVREAAMEGLAAAAAMSWKMEYGGAIFRRADGCFLHTAPVTTREPARLKYRVRIGHGMVLAGIYHTHTPGGDADSFSDNDIAVQQRLGVPSFIAVLDDQGRMRTIKAIDPDEVPSHRFEVTTLAVLQVTR
jgi:proteasome lid subunit RPN8/RPN11